MLFDGLHYSIEQIRFTPDKIGNFTYISQTVPHWILVPNILGTTSGILYYTFRDRANLKEELIS
jgi:hypothetical protein